MPSVQIGFTEDAAANALLASNPLALLIGMLLDQQVPMEWAFTSPLRLTERLDGDIDAATIAALSEDEVVAMFVLTPALHRYPAAMARRAHALCQHLVAEWDGDAAAVWRDADDGKALLRNLQGLPGYGKQKAQIMVAILGKRYGVTPDGWQAAAGAYGEPGFRSIADVVDADTLLKVRETKQAAKAAAKAQKKVKKNASEA